MGEKEGRPVGPGRGRIGPLALILALSLALNLTAVWWGLPQAGSWAPDEIPPSQVYDGAKHLFAGGWFTKYPFIHYYLLSLIVMPLAGLYDAGALRLTPIQANSLPLLLERLLSVAMAVGLVGLVFAVGRGLAGRRAGLIAAAMTAVLVPLPYYAKTANLDVPYLFWFTASLLFFGRALREGRRRDLILFAVTAMLSVCTKDQAYGLYILAPFALVVRDWRARPRAGQAVRAYLRAKAGTYGLAVAAAAGTFALGHNLVFNWSGFLSHLRLIAGPASQGYEMFPASAAGQVKLLGLSAAQFRFCLGWPFLILCLAGLVYALLAGRAPAGLRAFALFPLAYQIGYIAVIRYSYDRFMLPTAVVLTLFGAAFLDKLLAKLPRRWPAAVLLGLFAWGFLRAASVDGLMLADSRYGVEAWLKDRVPAGATIGTATDPTYLPRLDGFRPVDVPLSLPEFQAAGKPDLIMFVPAYARSFAPDSPEAKFFAGFASAPPGYVRVHAGKTRPPLLRLDFEGIATNLAAIGPEIEVYARRDVAGRIQSGRR